MRMSKKYNAQWTWQSKPIANVFGAVFTAMKKIPAKCAVNLARNVKQQKMYIDLIVFMLCSKRKEKNYDSRRNDC